MKIQKAIVALSVAAALTLTGCTSIPAATHETHESKAVTIPKATPKAAPKPVENPLIKPFGDAVTWTDGVSLSVSTPAAFQPGEFAVGLVDGQSPVIFTLVLTNNSDKVIDPMPYATLSSGGAESESIYDSGNPIGDVGHSPETSLLPGQSVTWLEAFCVSDLNDLTFQVAPTFSYKKAIFTTAK